MEKILVFGDVAPIGSNGHYDLKSFESVSRIIQDHQHVICNLESPANAGYAPRIKSGSHIAATINSLVVLKNIGISACGLANNHIMDFGVSGLKTTMDGLSQHGIATFGAGLDLEEAQKPAIFRIKSKNIAFFAAADNEGGAAHSDNPGFATLTTGFISKIEKAIREFDYVVVMLHDGREYYPLPSPELQSLCRSLVDLGVSGVLCQHNHVLSASEIYYNGFISYGQGNNLFDYRNDRRDIWSYSIVYSLSIRDGNLDFYPIYCKQTYPGLIQLIDKELIEVTRIKTRLDIEVKNPHRVKQLWQEYLQDQRDLYLSHFITPFKIINWLFRKLKLIDLVLSKDRKVLLQNLIRSRVHKEILTDLLDD
jgi:poly-gamma-glutamate capsule biosynthesis protein CapA/YwtB (metallophosphatase superfamily)